MTSSELWRYKLEEALTGLPEGDYGSLLPKIREVVFANLQNGRLQRFMERDGSHTLSDYVRQVARTVKNELEGIERLAAKEQSAWVVQHKHLRAKAYFYLMRLGVDHYEAYQRANDFAQAACEDIFKARYPMDVPYTTWVQTILRNRILQEMWRKPDLLDVKTALVPFEEDDGVEPADPITRDQMGEAEDREVLQWAITQLPSDAQRAVIQLTLTGYTDEEIAAQMGRTVQAVYNLRHRALQEIKSLVASSSLASQNNDDG